MANNMSPKKSGPSNLIAEKRMDVNGRLVTRHVRDGSSNSGPSAALAASTATAGGAKAPVPLNQNWETTSRANAEQIANAVGMGVKDPDKLWDNIDFYTGMLESKHGDIALEKIANDKVTTSIRDAWLAKHGATIGDRAGYMNIGGDEGYEAYRDAFGALAEATGVAERRSRERQFEATLQGKGSDSGLNLNVDDRGRASVDVPFEHILNHKPTPGERDRIAAVSARLSARLGTSEVPEDVGGSTVAWSDINPFKRKKK